MRTTTRRTLRITIYNILYTLTLTLTRCITQCNTPYTRVIFRLTRCIYIPKANAKDITPSINRL